MGVDSSVTVGLSVGIPAAVIIGVCVFIWWFNQRKQRKEDLLHDEIDLELKDDGSFVDMHDAILRTRGAGGNAAAAGSGSLGAADAAPDKESHQYNESSHSSSSVTDPSTPRQPPRSHAPHRTPSSYDFYESVIPVLPAGAGGPSGPAGPAGGAAGAAGASAGAGVGSTGTLAQPPPLHPQGYSTPSKSNSSASIVNPPSSKSLDSLAKQLTQPAFFEKLPSRTVTRKPEVHSRPRGSASTNSVDRSSEGQSVAGSDGAPLSNVLGGQFDQSFSEESPFGADGVVFK
ncbi:Suppressor of lethality of KEX2 GAS1 double null mutant protein 1 [[Candida] zeylanoides]